MNPLRPMRLALTVSLIALSGWLAPMAAADDTPHSLRGTDVTANDNAPDVKTYKGGKPGGTQKVARTFSKQPPVIPHSVENFDEITLEENQCLGCHGPDTYKKKNAPKVGDSHFKDREGKVLTEASHLRHNCVQCHVPQVDAPPLVENDFKGDIASAKPAAKAKK